MEAIVLIRVVGTFLVAVLMSGAAIAQSFAALSLIGYQLSIVQAGHSTGTSRDTNLHEAMPLPDRSLDLAALRAVDQTMRKARPDAKLVMLAAPDASRAEAAKSDMTPGSSAFASVTGSLAKAAADAGAQRLIVVLPARVDLRMQFEQGALGRGRAAGLGLYVDRDTPMRSSDNREVANGFLGVFANFRIAVLDAPSGRVLADDAVTSGTAFSSAHSKDADPMTALSGDQKLKEMERLLQVEIARVLPPMLARAS